VEGVRLKEINKDTPASQKNAGHGLYVRRKSYHGIRSKT
jgi:hypothetical protein